MNHPRVFVPAVTLLAALCLLNGGNAFGSAQAEPTLSVTPGSGTPATEVGAAGSGFDCMGFDDVGPTHVDLLWDDKLELGEFEAADGSFEGLFSVPEGAFPGDHLIAARCANDPDEVGFATFTVADTALLSPADELALSPSVGRPSVEVAVSGTALGCKSEFDVVTVQVLWDDEQELGRFITELDGTYDGVVTVPEGSPPGGHLITARCAVNPDVAVRAPFMVVEPIPDPSGSPGGPSTPRPEQIGRGAPPSVERDGGRSLFPSAVASLSEIDTSAQRLLASLALTLLLILLIGFPSELFDRTFEENYEEITRFLRHFRRGLRGFRVPSALQFAGFSVIAAGLMSLVDPAAAADRKTFALMLGLLGAVAVNTLAYSWPPEAYSRGISGTRRRFRTLPAALLIAALLVLLSRVAAFTPGYVYGLVGGYASVELTLSRKHQGRAVLFGALSTLMLGAVAWLLWGPVDHAIETSDPSFGLLVADAFLAGTFTVGVEMVLFALVPLRFLDGMKLADWNRGVWFVVYGSAAFLFTYVMFGSRAEEAMTLGPGAAVRMLVLFLIFGAASIAFWGFFALRHRGAVSPS